MNFCVEFRKLNISELNDLFQQLVIVREIENKDQHARGITGGNMVRISRADFFSTRRI